jgi:hypothetical protein
MEAALSAIGINAHELEDRSAIQTIIELAVEKAVFKVAAHLADTGNAKQQARS